MSLEFWVKLIVADKEQTYRAMESLAGNCTTVDNFCWIFEGDIEALEDDGVVFNVLGEGAVPCLGDMSHDDLISLCYDVFGVDIYSQSYNQIPAKN